MDHKLPMNRFFVSRYFFPAAAHDFKTAVQAMRDILEDTAQKKYNLQMTFYRAAENTAAANDGEELRPSVEMKTIHDLNHLDLKTWYASALVTAQLVPADNDNSDNAEDIPAATLTARWPDSRRIDIEITPRDYGADIARRFMDDNFILWTRGFEFY